MFFSVSSLEQTHQLIAGRRLQPLLFAQHYPPENDRLAGEVIFWRMVLMPYSRGSHTAFHHRYHIVWAPKYRFKVRRLDRSPHIRRGELAGEMVVEGREGSIVTLIY